jgi:hypothetical protein
MEYVYTKLYALSSDTCSDIINIYNKYNNNNPLIIDVKHNKHECVSNILSVLENELREYFNSIYKTETVDFSNKMSTPCDETQDKIIHNNISNDIAHYEAHPILNHYIHKKFSINTIILEKQYKNKNKQVDYNNSYKHVYKDIKNKIEKHSILKYIFFLNNVEDGGEVMIFNKKYKPEKGLLIIVPTEWFFKIYESFPLSDNKYIIHGCIYYDI